MVQVAGGLGAEFIFFARPDEDGLFLEKGDFLKGVLEFAGGADFDLVMPDKSTLKLGVEVALKLFKDIFQVGVGFDTTGEVFLKVGKSKIILR